MDTPRKASLVLDLCEQLARAIREHTFGQGRWLPPERELAEQYGVSRTVLREAVQRLESQGLLEIRHGVGIRVVDRLHKGLNASLALRLPDLTKRLRQLTEARLLIEPGVAALAAHRATPEQIAQMHQAQEKIASAQKIEEAVEADLLFHRTLAAASGNEVLMLVLESAAELGRESRNLTISTYGAPRAHEQHGAILAAVEAHDPAAAEACMRKHLTITAEEIEKLDTPSA